jgi:NAD(P)-dependent dehydrogenase (short-subunit alcohol dehydrogenase family)
MSKAALGAMVRSLAVELAAHVPRSPASPNDPTDAPGVVIEDARGGGVRVNGVAPGVVAFPASGYESTQAEQRAYLERVPMGRPGEPEDAARTVRALVFELTYLTGHVLPVDGGRSLA